MRLRAEGLLLLTIAFSFALSLTETSKTSTQPKDGRFGSEVSSGNLTESPRDGHWLQKRSAETLPRAPGGEEDKKQEFYEVSQGVLDGRMFPDVAGKRAKKEYSGDDYCSRGWRARIEGVLNKRFLSSLSEMMGNKKASLAFGGPRGKKSRDYEGDAEEPREFLVSSGLLDEAEPGEEADERKWEEVRGGGEGVRKRSPYAFQGMRGKKEYEYELKRAMGFLGMRGKKATGIEQYKRAPQTSFFGMKGKKAQSSGFFGMRGKKDSPNGFSGIKEEHQPSAYELENFTSLNQIKQSRASNSRYRRGISWLNNSKKAKNAFFGIRGKKSTPERPGYRFFPSF